MQLIPSSLSSSSSAYPRAHQLEVRRKRWRVDEGVPRAPHERPVCHDVRLDCFRVDEFVREQRLAEARAVGGVAAADDRGHLRALTRWGHLREVDDLGTVELGVMGRLAEVLGERPEQGLDHLTAVELLVIGEREADELEPETVAAAFVVIGEPGPAERGERAMEARLGNVRVAGQLVEPDATRVVAEAAQDGEDSVGAGEPPRGGLTWLARRDRIHARHWNTIPVTGTT